MTQEEKQLLIIDLCARLPYGVKLFHNLSEKPITFNSGHLNQIGVYKIKPYLRPMSSMTDKEREEWADLFMKPICELGGYTDEKKAHDIAPILYGKSHQVSIDWLNKKLFDYRGLIEKGLALEAPEGMYKNE